MDRMKENPIPSFILLFLLAFSRGLAQPPPAPAFTVRQDARGVTLKTGTGVTRVEIWSDRIVRVMHFEAQAPLETSLAVIGKPEQVQWKFTDEGDHFLLDTAALRVRVDKAS